ncbi:MAG: chalcone isomerase family protein [Gammaproteobacteria bacterium]|nr:chalcone isomerase family protein [Gammaproteobacteria bacterium]
MKHSLLAAAMLLATPLASAAELADVTVPDSVTVGGTELTLNGLGLREAGWIDVYVGALYLTSPTNSAEAVIASEGPSRISLHFVRDVGEESLTDAWKEGFANNSDAATQEAIADRMATFNGFFGDIEEGQSMVFDMIPGKGTLVTIAGEEKGMIEGDDFASALRAIWFGPEPPDDDLKEGMLGED